MRRLLAALLLLAAAPACAMDTAIITATHVANGHAMLRLDDGREVALADIVIPADAPSLAQFKGEEVTLQSLDTDRYGRLTAIVKPRGGRGQASIQETLLAQGEALTYSPTALHQWDRWQPAEHEAEQNHRGWWATHGVTAPAQAQHRLQQFVILEGRVTIARETREAYEIRFDHDVTIKIPRAHWRAFDDTPTITTGTLIRARGTLISDHGPTLILTRPEQLEIQHANP